MLTHHLIKYLLPASSRRNTRLSSSPNSKPNLLTPNRRSTRQSSRSSSSATAPAAMAWPRRSCSARTHLRARPCGSRKGARVLTRIYATGRDYNSGLNRGLRVNRESYSVEPICTYCTNCILTTQGQLLRRALLHLGAQACRGQPRLRRATHWSRWSCTRLPRLRARIAAQPGAHAHQPVVRACRNAHRRHGTAQDVPTLTLTLNPTLITNSSPNPNPNQPSS